MRRPPAVDGGALRGKWRTTGVWLGALCSLTHADSECGGDDVDGDPDGRVKSRAAGGVKCGMAKGRRRDWGQWVEAGAT